MFLEAFVIGICINGQSFSQNNGCHEVTAAYFEQSKELKEFSKALQKKGDEIAKDNKMLVYFLTPMYAIAAHQPAKILLFRGTTFNIDPWNNFVGLQWSY